MMVRSGLCFARGVWFTMQDRASWIQGLQTAARSALAGEPVLGAVEDPERAHAWVRGFADGYGARRACDAPMLSRLLGLAVREAEVRAGAVAGRQPDAALWWLLHAREVRVRELIDGQGALFSRLHAQAIEMWTEAELSGLHALWWHARGDAGLRGRCVDAAMWLMREIQPDNGTNRPWAVQVFVEVSLMDEMGASVRSDALMYAQTLFHNALVPSGVPDRFSACIFLDAAAALRGV